MEKKKCKECGKSFEAKRADSLYCSGACKQKAHYKRSIDKPNFEKQQTNVIYLEEFNKLNWNGLDLIVFGYFRKNISGNVTEDEILSYFNSIFYVGVDDNFENILTQIIKSKSFLDYQERFLSGEVKIVSKRESLA